MLLQMKEASYTQSMCMNSPVKTHIESASKLMTAIITSILYIRDMCIAFIFGKEIEFKIFPFKEPLGHSPGEM